MPTLFRFLVILSLIVGAVAGSLYVLAEYFQPEPKEISKALRNVKARLQEDTASNRAPETTGSPGTPPAPAPGASPASTPVPASPASAPVDSASQGHNRAQ
jgi:hypothetical protein